MLGGGLKGIAHVGVFEALEELGIKIDFLSRNKFSEVLWLESILCGYSVQEMKDLVENNYKIMSTIEKMPIAKIAGSYVFHKNIEVEGLSDGGKIEDLVNY